MVTIAIVAGCVPALQPMLLGGLLAEGRIGGAAIGYAATVEGLGMAVASAAASALAPPRRLRTIAALAILAALVANVLTIVLPAPGIIAARGLGGIGNGVLLWVLVGMMTRSAIPARLFAIYVTAQASLGFVLSLAFASVVLPRYGVLAGYGVLIALNLALLAIVRAVPDRYAALEQGGGGAGMPPPRGLLALAAVVLQLAGVMAFWVYSIPLGLQAGLTAGAMRMMIGAANGAQIVAGLAAIGLAARLGGRSAVVLAAVASIAALLLTAAGGGAPWLPAMLVFAFCWMFAPPFHIAFLIAADPSRRAAMFVSTAQLVGMAVGPLLASLATKGGDYAPARLVGVVCFAATLLIAIVATPRSR